MGIDRLRYDVMVERALRGVLREVLQKVRTLGLPGDHHLYITFRTDHPRVEMSDKLRQRYPKEITIVLQYQFWDLQVEDTGFAVTLSFNQEHERLVVPFAAVTAFSDPSINFGLQFSADMDETAAAPAVPVAPEAVDAEPAEKVVALDAFRKK
ncbi:MAG: SspB family protein [Alphaproteobacteria bacterium]